MDKEDLKDYLRIRIEQFDAGKLQMLQPQLINQILQDLGHKLSMNQTSCYATKSVNTPAASTVTLTRDLEGPVYNEKWDYHSIVGKLNFLEKLT